MKSQTIVITGASRGIGRCMALSFAQSGWNVVILAKTAAPHPTLDGTIYTVADEIEAFGGSVLPLAVDVRFDNQVRYAIQEAAAFGGGVIDALINNASALYIDSPTQKQITLMNQIISDGTRFCTKACLPYLQKSDHPTVINISPPLPMESHWIQKYGAYAKAKRSVSEYTKNMGAFYPDIAWHTLWPKKMIYTAATTRLFGEEKARKHTRKAQIMADAAGLIAKSGLPHGGFWLDEWVLKDLGKTVDFSGYLLTGTEEELYMDVFV